MFEIAGGIVLAVLFLAALPLLLSVGLWLMLVAPILALLAGMLGAYGADGTAGCWTLAISLFAFFLLLAWTRSSKRQQEVAEKRESVAYNLGRATRNAVSNFRR